MEIEAKFITQPEIFDEISKLKEIDGYKLKEIIDIKECDTYLDTEDLSIHKHEMSLRIREKDNTFLVTLKRKPVKKGPIYSRIEEEEYIDEKDIPSVYDYSLKIKPVVEANKLTGGRKLSKIFSIDKKRKRAVFIKNDFIIRLDMDTIQFLIDHSDKKQYELEIEAKNAPIEEVEKIQNFLIQKFGNYLKPSKHSKYERGLALIKK